MILRDLLFISWFIFIVVIYFDDRCKDAPPESIRAFLESRIFFSYNRRVVAYFLSVLGVPFYFVFSSYLDFWNDPLVYLGLYFMLFLVVFIVSVLAARNYSERSSSSEPSD
ncbi:MAG: hypothetical protein RTV72_14770 [Candidatus Thorarchaeota archaeon]